MLFKLVYFYLHIGITCHFYKSQHVPSMLFAWKFIECSQMLGGKFGVLQLQSNRILLFLQLQIFSYT